MYLKFIVLALFAATAAGAQHLTKAKEVATRAVDKANARTEALGDQQKPVEQKAPAQDSAKKVSGGAVVASMGTSDLPALTREVFAYDGGGRRDPFTSLTRTGALRPHISELQLEVVMVATNNSKAVATVKDSTSKERYVVKVGDNLGRYRVVQIDKSSVTFAIEEFGFSRQEKLTLVTSKEENQ